MDELKKLFHSLQGQSSLTYSSTFELPQYLYRFVDLIKRESHQLHSIPVFKLDNCHTLFIPLKHVNNYKLVRTDDGFMVVPSTFILIVFYINQCEDSVEVYSTVGGVWYRLNVPLYSGKPFTINVMLRFFIEKMPRGGFEEW